MLGLLVLAVLSFLSLLLLLLNLRSFSDWGGFENHSSYWERRSGSSFCCLWLSGAEEDSDPLLLTDKFLQAVLAEAQVVCIGQPVLIAGDLNADPAVIPCLAKGISAGRFVDLALAFSLRAGLTPDATCRFSGDEGTGSRRDFFVGCPNALAASDACFVTDRWFTPHFSVLARFCIDAWMAYVACPGCLSTCLACLLA